LFGGLVALIGVALMVASLVLLGRSINRLPAFSAGGPMTITDATGHTTSYSPSAIAKQAQDYLLRTGLLYFVVIVLIGTSGGYILARQALRPIARVTRMARELSAEKFDQRINLGGPQDELRELADTFDEMITRLDAAFDSQRLFVANASHELRTPLSVIRTELDVTMSDPYATAQELREMGEVVLSATGRAQHLVASLLTLARLRAGLGGELDLVEPVDLALLAPYVLTGVRAEAAERGVRIECELATARTLGDPRLLERVMGNLVENGVRHNEPGGWLRLSCGQTPERAWLHVANGGPVIAPEDVTTLFEAFRRGRDARARTATKGAGLGLAIVKLIVDTHHGWLQAVAPPSGGLAVSIELPGEEQALARLEAAQSAASSASLSASQVSASQVSVSPPAAPQLAAGKGSRPPTPPTSHRQQATARSRAAQPVPPMPSSQPAVPAPVMRAQAAPAQAAPAQAVPPGPQPEALCAPPPGLPWPPSQLSTPSQPSPPSQPWLPSQLSRPPVLPWPPSGSGPVGPPPSGPPPPGPPSGPPSGAPPGLSPGSAPPVPVGPAYGPPLGPPLLFDPPVGAPRFGPAPPAAPTLGVTVTRNSPPAPPAPPQRGQSPDPPPAPPPAPPDGPQPPQR
ncbi:MAG: HAMP domain-containing histidine kinase, partial [Actinomycetia bacterium]|nr:HAMP domain-containing histidine kinase [Actinomycetes bacterium]